MSRNHSSGAVGAARDWTAARVVVVGLARSGVAACLFLKKRGAEVIGTDLRAADALGDTGERLQEAGVEVAAGAYPQLNGVDAIILSPGVDPSQPAIAEARAQGTLVLPELELGASAFRGRMVCITGTKGKSTATVSLHAMLREAGLDARAVGNIGDPITAFVDGSDERSVFVVEASSFQLETTQDFRPHCAVFLNLFPDHLDRHPSFEVYAAAKARIFANQTPEDSAVVNGDDEKVMTLARRGKARVIPFRPRSTSDASNQKPGAYFHDGNALLANAQTQTLFVASDVQIPGSAVRTNLLAAATAAHHLGIPADPIRAAIRKFRGVPHTFEKLGEVAGVSFFNDSKATTLESVRTALESFDSPVLAIMGGRLKAGSFTSLTETVARHARAVYAIGESRDLIRAAFAAVCEVHVVDSIEEAVRQAHTKARAGETILLSPGCASFDMFANYAERGETFRRAYRDLTLQGAA